jgi:ubiquinone/menaquinone biosynthesis C-methylase UbiE
VSGPSDRLRDVYEQRAEVQYGRPVPLPDPRVDRKFERVWELLDAHLPCDAFLDAGCGDGRHLAAIAAAGYRPARVVGTDISERILETARATAAELAPELIRANLEALPLQDSSFDLVLCTQVVEHLIDVEAGMRELARVLRPGGTLILTTDNRRRYVSKTLAAPRTAVVRALRLRHRYVHFDFPHAEFTREEVGALLRSAGLEVVSTETFRFSIARPIGGPHVLRALNRIEKALPRHGVGDIIAVVARRPG